MQEFLDRTNKIGFPKSLFPETLPGVKCFKSLDDAKKEKTPDKKDKVIIRKCGKWNGNEPKGPEVPTNSISGNRFDNDYDYAILYDGMWTNVQNVTNERGQITGQQGYYGQDEPKNNADKWPSCMYCVYFKDAKEKKK